MSPCRGCRLLSPPLWPPGHPVTVTEEGGLLDPSPHLPSGRLLGDFQGIEPHWCQEAKAYFVELTLNSPEGFRCFVYLTPEPAVLFKIKSDIVFCVTVLHCFCLAPVGGRGPTPPGRQASKLGGGAAGRKSRPGSDDVLGPWRRLGGGGLCGCWPQCGPCTRWLRHGMCCSSSTNGAASSPSSGCSARARASSGRPWPWQPWPDHRPGRCLQTRSPQTAAAWTCAPRSGATAWPSAAAPSVRRGLASNTGTGAAGHDPPCPGKDSAGLPRTSPRWSWRPLSQALGQAWGEVCLSLCELEQLHRSDPSRP